MNAKVFSIVLAVVAALLLVMVLVQKNGYASQAQENYEKKSLEYKKYGSSAIEYVNTNIMLSKQAWAVACGAAEKGVKTSSDLRAIERAEAPAVKGADNFKTFVHRFEISSNYFIEATFKKMEEDKNGLKFLTGFTSMNINALLGDPSVAAEEDDEDEEEAEEAEEAPVKKVKKAAKKKEEPVKKSKKKSKKKR